MNNMRFAIVVVLLLALGAVVVYWRSATQESRETATRCLAPEICEADVSSHASMSWVNGTSIFWTVSIEHHDGKSIELRIGPDDTATVNGILTGKRQTLVWAGPRSESFAASDRYIGVCDIRGGHNHTMMITEDGIKMLMEGKWMDCKWINKKQ